MIQWLSGEAAQRESGHTTRSRPGGSRHASLFRTLPGSPRSRPAPAILPAAAASAALADKPQVLSGWTQTSAASYNSWTSARANQGNWSAYGFDWSTDYCSSSPDNPFGFPFQTSCARHDFDDRNYKNAGAFDANKARNRRP